MSLNELIGQKSVKRHLAFMKQGFTATGRIPNLLFAAPAGAGKTEFAKRFSAQLTNSDGSTRPFVEINCGSLKKARDFFEVIYPHKIADRDVNVLFDECHALPTGLETQFLTLFAVNKSSKASIDTEEGSVVELDFKRQSYIFATTETDKIFHPLKERLDEITFDYYSEDDMRKMLALKVDAQLHEDVYPLIIPTVRSIPRRVVKLSEKINMYSAFNGTAVIDPTHWAKVCYNIGMLPYGITKNELFVLQLLRSRGEQSLQALTASTGLSRSALMYDVENGLMKMGFMEKGSNSKRLITARGLGALTEAETVQKSWG